MATLINKKTFKIWKKYLGVGLHALLALMICGFIVQLVSYIFIGGYHFIFDHNEQYWYLEAIGGILFMLLVGFPLFGFFFSKLYPTEKHEKLIETEQQQAPTKDQVA